jgi:rod shape-determining protein MreD
LVGLVLILLQGVAFRFLPWITDLTVLGVPLRPLLTGATPNLVLPMVVYLGIHEESMARGALLSFGLGWELDLLGGGPAFIHRFTLVAVWWLSKIASARVSTQSVVMRLPLAFAASLAESVIILTLLAIFGQDSKRPLELSALLLPRALATTLLAPAIFDLSHRLAIFAWGGPGRAPAGAGTGTATSTAART